VHNDRSVEQRAVSEFFEMGGYAAFVWSAYGLAALVLAWLVVSSVQKARSAETELESLRDSRKAGKGS